MTAVLSLAGLSGCSAAYKMLGPEYGSLPPCGVQIHVVSPRGDFTEAQKIDIQAALADIGFWSNRDVVYAGEVDYRSDTPGRPGHTIVAERDNRYVGYAMPGKFIKVGGWINSWPSPSGPVRGYATFRGGFLHEATHAIGGLEDLYNEGDGYPGLIMGRGYLTMNQLQLGDIKGLQAGGCK